MLKVQNLLRKTPTLTILKNINFEAKQGEVTAVIGPSGSGKTSLLRCIAQLDPYEDGAITLKGRNLTDLSHGEIGLVFQAFNLFPHMSILNNLILAPTAQGKEKNKSLEKANDLLEQFSLPDRGESYPGQLSGGQKQRVAIARALMMEPPILLFDEPTSALDPEMVKDVGQIIQSVQRNDRVILLVTHEIRLAKAIADRILFFDHGELLDNMEAKKFFAEDNSHLSLRAQKFLANFI